jgi:hypothetical protein
MECKMFECFWCKKALREDELVGELFREALPICAECDNDVTEHIIKTGNELAFHAALKKEIDSTIDSITKSQSVL